MIEYVSTRDCGENKKKYSSAEAIKMGLAPDGGLFVPDKIPTLDKDEMDMLCGCGYSDRAAYILSKYLTDFDPEELKEDCRAAYSEKSFEGGATHIERITFMIYSLELWHGPTAAFKDMALQIMPRLLSRALKMTGEKRTALILVATSGDTGKAALEGYKDIDGIRIMVFYPNDGVSAIQKAQMTTQTGNNVNVCAIYGNFDDAQNGVKEIFSDTALRDRLDKNGYFLSSANSINWGRLAPQIAYYVSAYCDMVNDGTIKYGEVIDVSVPTGNFGNILAAYFAKLMGVPIGKLICASNSNNVLTDFIHTGTYDRNRKFNITISPSMDILISSNLERLLWMIAGPEKTSEYMRSLHETGKYTVDDFVKNAISENFVGYFATENNTFEMIERNYDDFGYLFDPHSAVGFYCAEQYLIDNNYINTQTDKKVLTVSTASPFKFATDVYSCFSEQVPENEFAAIELLSEITHIPVPKPLCGLDSKEIRFKRSIDPKCMRDEVTDYLGIK